MKRLSVIFLFVFLIAVAALANEKLIHGTVYDKQNGEVLIGAEISDVSTKRNAITDARGRYSIWILASRDSVRLKVSYLGYTPQIRTIKHITDNLDWYLEPALIRLNEVVVSDKSRNSGLSVFSLKKAELDAMPTFGAEKDLLLYFQLRPGVQLAGDGNSNLYVRGGSSDQNLFLLDDMPLYHVSHLGGINSTFNSDIIKSADLYLGAFPTRYGGRLSSVVDVHTKDGDLYKHHQSLTLGILTSKIMLEGPLLKGRASYLTSFRVNSLPFFRLFFGMDTNFSMYDANVKLNYIVSPTDRLFFSFYTGNDALKIERNDDSFLSNIKTDWGNIAGALRYNKVFSSYLFANFSGGFSQYRYGEQNKIQFYENQNELSYFYNSKYTSSITDYYLKSTFDYLISPVFKTVVGYELCLHSYIPGQNRISSGSTDFNDIDKTIGYPSAKSTEQALFAELQADDLFGFFANIGVRGNLFYIAKKSFSDFQPRIVLSRKLGSIASIKASYTHIWQVFHLLSGNGAGLPTDYRIPAMAEAPPSTSKQVSLGLNIAPARWGIEFSIEGYFKSLANLAELKEGVAFTSSDFSGWENILARNGEGNSKGIELLLRKNKGRSSGWIGATIANTTRRFDDLNEGKSFAYKYDRRFSFSCLFQQKITNKFSFSFTWVYGTGLPLNLPQSQYDDAEGNIVLIYGSLNKFRERDYHRLDIGANYEIKTSRIRHLVSLSIINVYNRRNPYVYITEQGGLYEFSLFPVLPSLSYTVEL